MMDPKDTVVSRELSDAELEGIIGGMGRIKARREAKAGKEADKRYGLMSAAAGMPTTTPATTSTRRS